MDEVSSEKPLVQFRNKVIYVRGPVIQWNFIESNGDVVRPFCNFTSSGCLGFGENGEDSEESFDKFLSLGFIGKTESSRSDQEAVTCI